LLGMRNAVGPVRFRQEVTESLPMGVNSADGLADTGSGVRNSSEYLAEVEC